MIFVRTRWLSIERKRPCKCPLIICGICTLSYVSRVSSCKYQGSSLPCCSQYLSKAGSRKFMEWERGPKVHPGPLSSTSTSTHHQSLQLFQVLRLLYPLAVQRHLPLISSLHPRVLHHQQFVVRTDE